MTLTKLDATSGLPNTLKSEVMAPCFGASETAIKLIMPNRIADIPHALPAAAKARMPPAWTTRSRPAGESRR